MTITVAEDRASLDHDRDPRGRLIASFADDRPRYALFDRGEAGYIHRFHAFGDFAISTDLRRVHCQLTPDADEGMLPVLVEGNVLAALLLLRGDCVLHASAVEAGGNAVALVGRSGAGKSTLAAVACRAGASMVTDDVLRVQTTGDGVLCHRGGEVLRLRPEASALVGAEDSLRQSADGRRLLTPPVTPCETLPLRAIVMPRLVDPRGVLASNRVHGAAALVALLGFPRVWNWSDPATSSSHLAVLADAVDRLPVYELNVPRSVAADGACGERLNELLFAGDQ